MTRWEYLEIRIDHAGGQWRPKWVNEEEIPNWKKGPNFFDYLNQLGDQGWEVVAAAGAGPATREPSAYLLKRPKQ